jgi:hypothetical protein
MQIAFDSEHAAHTHLDDLVNGPPLPDRGLAG